MLNSEPPGEIVNTHSNEHLHCRDFGSACLDTQHLMEWLASTRRRLPVALSRDFVQVEWLLSAIQHQVQDSLTRAEALEIVHADPRLRGHEMAVLSPRWLLGGEAYLRWAALITAAVSADELQLLDFASKLPALISQADQTEQDIAGYGVGHEWKHEASTMAIQYCVEAFDEYAAEHGATANCPLTQDKAAKKLVTDLASMGRTLKYGGRIQYESAISAIKPWTAPEAAKAIIQAREISKFSGN
jgi:hypothetical protein